MRISFLCTFEPHTAGGILTLGRARGAAANGHDVKVVFQPFKTDSLFKDGKGKTVFQQPEGDNIKVVLAYSAFFSKGFLRKLVSLPKFIFWDFWRVFGTLVKSEIAVIHKPLPLSFFYLVCLKVLGYRGIICCVNSDWEGVGGYADLTFPEKIMRKLFVTYCEEKAPYLSDVIWCASKTLYDRFGLSERLRPKRIYLTCGGDPFEAGSKKFNEGVQNVIYSGTYKSRQVVEFLARTAVLVHAKSRNFRFLFLGSGPFLRELQDKLAAEMTKEHFECPGHFPHQGVIDTLNRTQYAVLYLNPEYPELYTEMSRSSTKLFEYLCAGCIVVASDIGEARNLLTNQDSGFLEGNAPELFAGRLLELGAMPSPELEAISQNAKRLFHERFSHPVQMKKLVDFCLERKAEKKKRKSGKANK